MNYSCQFCNRQIATPGALATHEPFCAQNPDRKRRTRSHRTGVKPGNIPWNKGLSGDPRCKRSDEYKMSRRGKSPGRGSTPEKERERIRKITISAKLKNGGYRSGSGRGKKGWYKGFFCDSSYELAYVIFCIEHNINIVRSTIKRLYTWEGKLRVYLPDFEVNGSIVEIKGYRTPQWEAKMLANPDIVVLYESDLRHVFEYVVNKYGKNFTELYETESLAESA